MIFDYDNIDTGYYHHIYNKDNPRSNWHKIKFNRVISSVSNDKHYEGILDYGCGPGTLLNLLKSKFKLGYDIAEDQLAFARKLVVDAEFTSEHSNIIQNFKKISHITACELIEHLNISQINELIKISKTIVDKRLDIGLKTSLIITTPNYKSLWPLLEIFVDLVSRQNYRIQHISKFNTSTMKELIINNFSASNYEYELEVSSFQGFAWINKNLIFIDKILEKINFGNLIFCKITFNKTIK